MPSSIRVRIVGSMLFLVGLFLVGLMGTITYYLFPDLLRLGVPSASGPRWRGTAQEAQLTLTFFAFLIFTGFTVIVNGLWAIVTGKTNKWMMGVMIGLILIIALTTFLLNQLLK